MSLILWCAAYLLVAILMFVWMVWSHTNDYSPLWGYITPDDEDIAMCFVMAIFWPISLIILGVLNFGKFITDIAIKFRREK